VDFFNLPNPSSCTMALGSTQPVTEMSTRNFPGGKKRPAHRADNLAAIYEPNVWICGSLDLLRPWGPPWSVQGKLYLYPRPVSEFHIRASTMCQEWQDLFNEINNLKCDLCLNSYPHSFIDLVVDSKGSSHLTNEEKPLGSVYIPYVKGASEKFTRIGNGYNIRMIFKTERTLSSLMKTRLERDPQQMSECVCSIPGECGSSCT
jgi:hypothetical protein